MTVPNSWRQVLQPLQPQKESAPAPWHATTVGSWAGNYELAQYLFVGPRGGGDYQRVGIFAGIHGDETAGIHAAIEFLQELALNPSLARGYEVYVYPICNPTGFERGTRANAGGADLNRHFWIGSREPEVVLLEQQIRTLRFNGLLSLHSDDESAGLYAFALGAQITQHVVEPALRAAEAALPRNRDARIDNFRARNGLIRKGYPGMLCGAPETRPRPFEIVFETPQLAPLADQIRAHRLFLRAALEQYQQMLAVAQDL